MTGKFKLTPASGTIVIRAGGAVIAESANALTLMEEGHEPVQYLPRADIAMAFLDASETVTTCPYKGLARHFHIVAKSGPIADAAWSYEAPIAAASAIRDYVGFYPDKVTIERL